MVSGEKRDIFVGKLSLLGDEWSPLRALSACGPILHKNPGKGQTPPPFQQCLDFGSFCSGIPSLSPLQTTCNCYSNPIEKWKFKVNVRFHVHLKLSWLNWIEKNKYALHFFSRQIFLREVFKYHLETSLRRILKNAKLIEYLFLSRRHFHCHISSDLTKLWTAITPV